MLRTRVFCAKYMDVEVKCVMCAQGADETAEHVHTGMHGHKAGRDAKQRVIFLASCGTRVFSLLLDLLKPATPHVKTLGELLATLRSHFSPAPSTLMERFRFNNRSRQDGETLGQFVAALRGLVNTCAFGDQLDSLLRDRFVCGINNPAMQTRLLELPDPSLDDAVKAALAIEAAAKDASEIARAAGSPSTEATKAAVNKMAARSGACSRCGAAHSPSQCQFLDKRGSYECPAPLGRGHAPLFPVPHTPPPLPSNRDGYVNLNLEEYPWFAGTMERDGATAVLEKSPSGTFLLRISTKQNGGYAISINFDSQVKHMRVCYDDGQFYLSESKMFRSIVELVSWYETHSLSESFKGLEISLLIPFKNVVPSPITNGTSMLCLSPTEPLGRAVALHNFQPTADSMLGLIKGDVVTVLSKAGQEKGWWKGQIQERVGYFPWQYVQELPSAGAEC
ncbi:guanine nucleotide exchange factor VAV3 isoform X2 [Ixodes scapularis]